MLSPSNRLTSAADFRDVVRRGRSAGGPLVVLHVRSRTSPASDSPDGTAPAPAVSPVRAGLVVSRAVGPAVTRNLVKRRLRHLLRERVGELEPGTRLVVRARPEAATATYAALGHELDRCLARVTAPAGPHPHRGRR